MLLGVDVGGTFTDAVLVDEHSNYTQREGALDASPSSRSAYSARSHSCSHGPARKRTT